MIRGAPLDSGRTSAGSGGINCRGADFSKASLGKARLQGADLRQAKMSGADLSATDLTEADLSGANLSQANLKGANLSRANLSQANFQGACLGEANLECSDLVIATLEGADLRDAKLKGVVLQKAASLIGVNLSGQNLSGQNFSRSNLSKASFNETDLRDADLSGANLSEANFDGADLHGANLSWADLSGAKLNRTELTRTDFSHADLTGSSIYAIAAWDVKLTRDTRQENLIITPPGTPAIVVDNIEVAQFVYLVLNNENIRNVIDTITSKAVLILGRFSPERKIILDRLREELRTRHHVPILFDFEKPRSRDTVETIRTLTGLSKFIIADLTGAKSVLQELQAVIPLFPSVPVRFIILKSEREPPMFDHIRRFSSVVPGAFEYETPEEVLGSIKDGILEPVEAKLKELSK